MGRALGMAAGSAQGTARWQLRFPSQWKTLAGVATCQPRACSCDGVQGRGELPRSTESGPLSLRDQERSISGVNI